MLVTAMTKRAPHLEDPLALLEQQHRLALREWCSTLSSVARYQLNLQMIALEAEVALLEAQASPQAPQHDAPARPPLQIAPLKTLDLTFRWQQDEQTQQLQVLAQGRIIQQHPVSAELLQRLQQHQPSLRAKGQQLYSVLTDLATPRLLQQAREASQHLRQPLRWRLQFSPAHPALGLPWEALHDGDAFLASHDQIITQEVLADVAQQQTSADLSGLRPLRLLSTRHTADPGSLRTLAQRFPTSLSLTELHGQTPLRLLKHLQAADLRQERFHLWHHAGDVFMSDDALHFEMGGKPLRAAEVAALLARFGALQGLVLSTTGALDAQAIQRLRQQLARWPVRAVLHLHSSQADAPPPHFFDIFYTVATLRPVDEAFAWALRTVPWAALMAEDRLPPALISPTLPENED